MTENDEKLDLNTFKRSFTHFTVPEKPGRIANILLILLLIAIPVYISYDIRMQPYDLSGIDARIEGALYNFEYQQIEQQFRAQNPGVPDSTVAREVERIYTERVRDPEHRTRLLESIPFYAAQEKAFYQDENGVPYMPDIDTYFWLYYAENVIETGQPGDSVRDGMQWDDRQLAPHGRAVTPDIFHAHFIAAWTGFLGDFGEISAERAMMWYPPIFMAIMVVLVFFIGMSIAGKWAGFIAALTMAVLPGALSRTLFGRGDTDVWVIFFPILAVYLFLEAFKQKNLIIKSLLAAISGIVVGFFSLVWGAWWYVFNFVLATIGIYLVYRAVLFVIKRRKFPIKRFLSDPTIHTPLILLGVFTVAMSIIVSFTGYNVFYAFLIGPLAALTFGGLSDPTLGTSIFPNVLTTVAELNPGGSVQNILNNLTGVITYEILSLQGLISIVALIFGIILAAYAARGAYLKKHLIEMGIMLIFIMGLGSNLLQAIISGTVSPTSILVMLGLLGLLAGLFARKDENGYDIKYGVLLFVWFGATIYATFTGIRFILLLAPAYAIATGVAVGYLIVKAKEYAQIPRIPKQYYGIAFATLILLAIFITPSFTQGYDTRTRYETQGMYAQGALIAQSDIPLINDAWMEVLTGIRENTQQDAIITSWWDFGHHFKYLAKRPITFDGTTQEQTPAHWVGRLLLTTDEREAVGILRMLDCSGNLGFRETNAIVQDDLATIALLKELVELDDADARTLLEETYTPQEVETILAQTHCIPPEGIVIASADMVGKAAVWGHFGSWDFARADIYNSIQRMNRNNAVAFIQTRLNVTENQAFDIHAQLSASSQREAQQWIAPYPSYYGTATCVAMTNETQRCVANLQGQQVTVFVNPIENHAYLQIQDQTGRFVNQRIVYGHMQDDAYFINTENTTPQLTLGAMRLPDGQLMLSDPAHVGSVFSRMYFYDGRGLSCFEQFSSVAWRNAGMINTYRAVWECTYG